jgi:uncharacterized protein
MHVLDTCILISATTNETQTERVLQWLARHVKEPLAINDWTMVETAAALMLKQRQGLLTQEQHSHAMSELRLRRRSFYRLEVTRDHFALAQQICERGTHGLRAGDALHAAVALMNHATLVTTDAALLNASGAYGLRCEAP